MSLACTCNQLMNMHYACKAHAMFTCMSHCVMYVHVSLPCTCGMHINVPCHVHVHVVCLSMFPAMCMYMWYAYQCSMPCTCVIAMDMWYFPCHVHVHVSPPWTCGILVGTGMVHGVVPSL